MTGKLADLVEICQRYNISLLRDDHPLTNSICSGISINFKMSRQPGIGSGGHLLPAHQETKFIVTTTDFFVWPPTFRDSILIASVCAAQNDRAI